MEKVMKQMIQTKISMLLDTAIYHMPLKNASQLLCNKEVLLGSMMF